MISEELIPAVLTLSSIAGLLLAYLYGHKTKRFRWSEYFLFISIPVLGSLGLVYFYGIKVLYLFIVSCMVGFVLEYVIGRMYHLTLNRRLWTYGKYSVQGYTSFLALPMWGVAGIVFWLMAKTIGL